MAIFRRNFGQGGLCELAQAARIGAIHEAIRQEFTFDWAGVQGLPFVITISAMAGSYMLLRRIKAVVRPELHHSLLLVRVFLQARKMQDALNKSNQMQWKLQVFEIVHETLDPTWNETITLYGSLWDFQQDGLLLRVLDRDVVSRREGLEAHLA